MEKSKMNQKASTITIAILSTILVVVGISVTVNTCNKKKGEDPLKTRLEEMNDSLLKEIKNNNIMIDSLYHRIDSLNFLTDTLIKLQPIINEHYTQEVYTILGDDTKRSNRRLSETLKASDSLLKSGFYTKTIEF
jgi:hypothetical protein